MVSGNIGNWARLWNPLKKNRTGTFRPSGSGKMSEFGTDENTLFTGSTDGNIFVWKKTEQPQPLDTVKKVVPTPVPVSIPEENPLSSQHRFRYPKLK